MGRVKQERNNKRDWIKENRKSRISVMMSSYCAILRMKEESYLELIHSSLEHYSDLLKREVCYSAEISEILMKMDIVFLAKSFQTHRK